jgi:hypothetical protein
MKPILFFLFLLSAASAGTLFLPAYPAHVLVVDEDTRKILDRIPTEIGLPTGAFLSYDRKKIYLTTQDHNGIAVLDLASRKITNHFLLNNGNRQLRFRGIAPDPTDKLLYSVVTEVVKLVDRFEIGKPKYAVIDLAQQQVVRTVDMQPGDQGPNMGFSRSGMLISPDGKYLYQFRNQVVVLNTSDFKVVDRIDLAKPEFPGMTNVGLGGVLEPIHQPGFYTSLFYAEDPNVHRRTFGIAKFDLNTRDFTYDPIGPTMPGMGGLEVSPDGKRGYTIVTSGQHGTRSCEFWAFDLVNHRRAMTEPYDCPTHFRLAISSTGKELYISGSGYTIDIFDSATLKRKTVTDLNNDITMAGMIVVP